jgi:hypothetical protein
VLSGLLIDLGRLHLHAESLYTREQSAQCSGIKGKSGVLLGVPEGYAYCCPAGTIDAAITALKAEETPTHSGEILSETQPLVVPDWVEAHTRDTHMQDCPSFMREPFFWQRVGRVRF